MTGGSLKRISHLNPLYSPLHYVLIFTHGEQGWHTHIPSFPGPNGERLAPNVTQRCYYVHRLHFRPAHPDTIFRGGRLFQQYVVDAWASIESSELFWLRRNQKNIRADLYQGNVSLAHMWGYIGNLQTCMHTSRCSQCCQCGAGRSRPAGDSHCPAFHSSWQHTLHVPALPGLHGHCQTLPEAGSLHYHDCKPKLARDPGSLA